MLSGSYNIPPVPEESVCRSVKKYRFTDVGVYKIHSTALMPDIQFGEAETVKKDIDSQLFLNDDETKPKVKSTIKTQNFLSTFYIGRCPLEFYSKKKKTEVGREFILLCREGNHKEDYRVFGTETAIRGFNKNAADMTAFPNGGDD